MATDGARPPHPTVAEVDPRCLWAYPPAVYLAYVDESGNTGLPGSRTYTLGCLFLDVDRWPDVFDQMIAFRRGLRDTHGVPVRAELKANYLLRGKGPLWPLALPERSGSRSIAR